MLLTVPTVENRSVCVCVCVYIHHIKALIRPAAKELISLAQHSPNSLEHAIFTNTIRIGICQEW